MPKFTAEQLAYADDCLAGALPRVDVSERLKLKKLLLSASSEYIRGKNVVEGLPKPGQQLADLRKIQSTALSLSEAISGSSESVHERLAGLGDIDLGLLQEQLLSCQSACAAVIKDMSGHGGPSTDPFLALLVGRVRDAMIECDIKPGKSKEGPFRQLLDMVFCLCGVSANGAHWLSKIPSLKKPEMNP